ncbi:alpha/beta fold hydrolase [Christiangramia aquimixticola]|uniref:alpha/beta fold hydrolase n=1 Tax=Christiangramia aquimixticola TaxID=1697558 RepID=UPI003AA846B3
MSKILYKGAKIQYEVEGNKGKVPLVLLHGFLEDSLIWRELLKKLKEERQIIIIDLPGHGGSENISPEHSMSMMAEVVHHILLHLNIAKVSMAGHSMGGYVSLEFLKKFPKMLQSIVLINSTPVQDSEERKDVRDRSVELVGKNKKAYISMAISNLFADASREKYATEIDELKIRALKMSKEGVQAALIGMKNRTNLTEELKNFENQKVIIAADEDQILDIRELERVSGSCKCDFFRLKNGHNSWLEDRKSLVKITQFIE